MSSSQTSLALFLFQLRLKLLVNVVVVQVDPIYLILPIEIFLSLDWLIIFFNNTITVNDTMLSWVTYLHIMSYFDKIIFDKGSKRGNVRQNRQNSLVYLGSKRAKTES